MGEPVHRIAVTGAAGYVGSRLVARLESEPGVERILATDIRPPKADYGPKVFYLQHDVTAPLVDEFAQHGIETAAHLAYVLRPSRDPAGARSINVGGAQNVLKASAESGVARIVYLSSTSVYGAHADNPPFLTEEIPPRPVKGFQYSEDKVQVESLLREYESTRPDVAAVTLRVCPVVGPNADNSIARAFLKPFLVAVRGADPPMQLIHEDDLIDVMVQCVLGGVSGTYNVAGEGTVRWSEMAEMLGRKLVALPAPLLYAATEAAWRLRLQSDSPSVGLDFIRYPWTASTEKARQELGFEPRYSSQEAWASFATSRGGSRTAPTNEATE